jgi:hypothetical protein
VLALLLILAAASASAQTPFRVEVAPTVGYRTGASLFDSGAGETFDVESSASWGAVADVSLGAPGLFFEVAWTRQETRVSFDDAFGPGLHDVTLDSFLAGGQWDAAPRSPIRPFLSALVGATRIEAPGSAATHFTAALGGGAKLMASDTFGVRLEARAIAVFSGGSATGLCGGSGCTIGLSGWGTLQADLSAGILIAF